MKYLFSAFLGFTLLTPAQTFSYSLLKPTTEAAPTERFDGTITYDPQGRRIFLFGGQDFTGPQNDLWTFSLADRTWNQLNPTGSKPAARFGHTLVYDSVRHRLILFGGQAGGFFSDTWAYDIATNAWRQLASDSAGPSRRYGHSAIYDTARDRVVISHGFTNSGRFDDTWAFELATNTWRNISPPSGAPRPLRRCLHHAALNAEGNEMLLYGGCSSGSGPCPQADLWSFDLTSHRWTERTPRLSPPGREHYGLAFDAVRSRLIVFGGSGSSLYNDTWEFDPRERLWQTATLAPGNNPPSARSRHEGAAAKDLEAVFFFGGTTDTGLSNELWMLAPTPKPRPRPVISQVVNAISGEGVALSPGENVRIAGSFPLDDGEVSVTINGIVVSLLAPPNAEEIRAQIPYETATAAELRTVVATGSTNLSEEYRTGLIPQHPGLRILAEGPVAADSEVALEATGLGVEGTPWTLRLGDRDVDISSRETDATTGITRIIARVPRDLEGETQLRIVAADGVTTSQSGLTITIVPPLE